MYIHTKTSWNVFLKHLHESVLWFIFICPFALFVCICLQGVFLLILIYSLHLNLFGFLSKFWLKRPNTTKVFGLCQFSKVKSGTRSSFGHTNYCCVYTGLESGCNPGIQTPVLFPLRKIKGKIHHPKHTTPILSTVVSVVYRLSLVHKHSFV